MEKSPLLDDLLVIELASVLAGPSVGMFLAELGAAVIKIENFRIGGDVTRSWKNGSEFSTENMSAYFSSVNWGKKSIGIDLRAEEGKKIIFRLIQKADIVISSFKPGDSVKLGLDPKSLMALNSKLIYAELTAYGPNDERPGFDAIIQAEAGFTFMNGTAESGPLKMPLALMDLLASHQLKEGILLALLKRERTGKGSYITTDLLSSAVSSLANQAANWLVAGNIPKRLGSGHPNIVPYGSIFKTVDEKNIVLAIGNDKQFSELCSILGLATMATDPKFKTNPSRVIHREETENIIAEKIALRKSDELIAELLKRKVPAAGILDMKEVFEQEQANNLVMDSGKIKGLRTVSFKLENENQVTLTQPPGLNENYFEVLEKYCGFSEEKINELIASGVVGNGN